MARERKKILSQAKKDRAQTAFVLFCCFMVPLFLQIFKFRIFPEKYFFDAADVQNLMQTQLKFDFMDSYRNTAIVMRWMSRCFPMDSQLLGGLVLWSLLILPCGWIAARCAKGTWEHYLLLSCYAVMLPIFVWNTHKEVLQFVFFLLLYVVAHAIKRESLTADLLIVSLIFLWGMVFRSYYMIVAIFSAFFLMLSRLEWEKHPKNETIKLILWIAISALILLLLIETVSPKYITRVFGNRISVNSTRYNDPNANTIILDLIDNPDGRLLIYLFNYVVGAVRMMFPFELLLRGIKYLPFVLFQLLLTFLLVKSIRSFMQGEIRQGPQKRLFCIVSGFYLTSFLFEPDFGSFLRHQAALFPIAWPLLMQLPAEGIPANKSAQGKLRADEMTGRQTP